MAKIRPNFGLCLFLTAKSRSLSSLLACFQPKMVFSSGQILDSQPASKHCCFSDPKKTSPLSKCSNRTWFSWWLKSGTITVRLYTVTSSVIVKNKTEPLPVFVFAAHADWPSQVGLPQRPVGSSSRGWRTGAHGAHWRSSASHTRPDQTPNSLLRYRLLSKFTVTTPACLGLTFDFSFKCSLLCITAVLLVFTSLLGVFFLIFIFLQDLSIHPRLPLSPLQRLTPLSFHLLRIWVSSP